MEFECDSFVEVLETGRIGLVSDVTDSEVEVEFYDNSVIFLEEVSYGKDELRLVEGPKLKASQLGAFVRGEIGLEQVSRGIGVISDELELDVEVSPVTVEDMLAGMNHYDGMPVEDVVGWLNALMSLDEDAISSNGMDKILDDVTDEVILGHVFMGLMMLRWDLCEEDPQEPVGYQPDWKYFKQELETWIGSGKTEYPEAICHRVVSQFDCDTIDSQSEETQQLFKKCLQSVRKGLTSEDD